MKTKAIEIGLVIVALFFIALFVAGCEEEVEAKAKKPETLPIIPMLQMMEMQAKATHDSTVKRKILEERIGWRLDNLEARIAALEARPVCEGEMPHYWHTTTLCSENEEPNEPIKNERIKSRYELNASLNHEYLGEYDDNFDWRSNWDGVPYYSNVIDPNKPSCPHGTICYKASIGQFEDIDEPNGYWIWDEELYKSSLKAKDPNEKRSKRCEDCRGCLNCVTFDWLTTNEEKDPNE